MAEDHEVGPRGDPGEGQAQYNRSRNGEAGAVVWGCSEADSSKLRLELTLQKTCGVKQ